jgi:hypothetical protein
MGSEVLNLAAGNRLINGAINHDLHRHRAEITVTHDLNITPWPWDDAQFTTIHMIDAAEHLTLTLIESLNECWRLLKPAGHLHLKYPLHYSPTIHDDPTHRWFWSERCLEYVIPGTEYGDRYGFYTPYKWRLVKKEIMSKRSLKAVLQKVGHIEGEHA